MPTDENPQAKTPTTQKEIRELGFLLDIPLEVSVEIGSTRMPIKDLLQLQEGSIIELDKLAGEPLDLYVNSRLIARGEAVMVKDRYGLRLTDVVSPAERLENLG
jgi:flagellar motor switch protein FliN/FliY